MSGADYFHPYPHWRTNREQIERERIMRILAQPLLGLIERDNDLHQKRLREIQTV